MRKKTVYMLNGSQTRFMLDALAEIRRKRISDVVERVSRDK